jgi:hypothetical protein
MKTTRSQLSAAIGPPLLIVTLSAWIGLPLGTRAATWWWDGGASTVNSASDNATTTVQNWLSGGGGANTMQFYRMAQP